MPWAIRKRGNKWVVINKNTGRVLGKHPTKKKAEKQVIALRINVRT